MTIYLIRLYIVCLCLYIDIIREAAESLLLCIKKVSTSYIIYVQFQGLIPIIHLLCLLLQIFMKHNTIRLNSRQLTIEWQESSIAHAEFKNANIAMRTMYGGLKPFWNSFPEEFVVEVEPDKTLGRYNIQLLRPLRSVPGEMSTCKEEDEVCDTGSSDLEEVSGTGASDQKEEEYISSYYTPQQQEMLLQHSIAQISHNSSSNDSDSSMYVDNSSSEDLQVTELPVSGNKKPLLDRLSDCEHQRNEFYGWSSKFK